MRVTNAGSWLTILCSWLAVLFGSSTVLTMRVVTSGRVAMVETFFTASATMDFGSLDVEGALLGLLRRVVGMGSLPFDLSSSRRTAHLSIPCRKPRQVQ